MCLRYYTAGAGIKCKQCVELSARRECQAPKDSRPYLARPSACRVVRPEVPPWLPLGRLDGGCGNFTLTAKRCSRQTTADAFLGYAPPRVVSHSSYGRAARRNTRNIAGTNRRAHNLPHPTDSVGSQPCIAIAQNGHGSTFLERVAWPRLRCIAGGNRTS